MAIRSAVRGGEHLLRACLLGALKAYPHDISVSSSPWSSCTAQKYGSGALLRRDSETIPTTDCSHHRHRSNNATSINIRQDVWVFFC